NCASGPCSAGPCIVPPDPPCTDPNGCVRPPPVCPEPACVGKVCGEACGGCSPADPMCPPSAEPPPSPGGQPAAICNLEGRWVVGVPAMVCPSPPPPSPPPGEPSCAGAPCGAPCLLCGPNQPNCEPAGVMGQCDPGRVCVAGPVTCM